MKYLLFLLLPAFFISCRNSDTESAQSSDTMSVASIINKSKQSYSALKIYLDSGKVIRDFYASRNPHKSALVFKTAYSEKEGFNFEYYVPNSSNSRYVINKTGDSVKTWWGITNQIKTPDNLRTALSSAKGVSSGCSDLVARLLLPEEFPQHKSIYDSFTPVLNGTETVNGVVCFKITGSGKSENKTTIWIAKDDFLIRKMETDRHLSGGSFAKMDSMMRSQVKRKINRLQKRADTTVDPKERAELLKNIELVSSRQNEISQRLKTAPVSQDLSIKTTTMVYPYQLKDLDKDLFTFRPNREVPL